METIRSKHNWSGHTTFTAKQYHEPASIEEIQEIVKDSTQVRVIGSRHSFNDIADSAVDQLWLGALEDEVIIDKENRTAKVPAGITYSTLCPILEEAGFALTNLASLKHITVVGAVTTATHGSGNGVGNLATVVSGVEMVTANGDLVEFTRDKNPDLFPGVVVSLGTLGVVTRYTLDLVPSFLIQQDSYEKIPFSEVYEHYDQITDSAYSVSLFPTWQNEYIETLILKRKAGSDEPLPAAETFFGATSRSPEEASKASEGRSHTPFGKPAAWHEALPHYFLHHPERMGDELQSEYFFPREHLTDVIKAIRGLKKELKPILGLSEIRSVASDDLWLSPAYGRDIVGIHFNWLKKWEGIKPVLPKLEEVLKPYSPMPHFGKLFHMGPDELKKVYPRLNDLKTLINEMDPGGKFNNAFIQKYILG